MLRALVLGLMHAVVDAASVATVAAEHGLERLSADSVAMLILGYDLVAFAPQASIGYECDLARAYRAALTAGLALTFLGVFAGILWPIPAMLLAGSGNALFHVGAGALVLNLAGGRAAEPGIFLAPGAVGLAFGQALGLSAFPCRWLMGSLLMVCTALVLLRRDEPAETPPPAEPVTSSPAATMAVALLWLAVLGRAVMGEVLVEPWKAGPDGAIALVLGAVLGQSAGGLIADSIGWRALPTISLLALALLGPWASTHWLWAGVAMLLCQASSGVTLAGLHRGMPGWPGRAFGLSALAVLLGAFPTFAGVTSRLIGWLGPLAAATLAAVVLGVTLVTARSSGDGARVSER